jgi:hypothetical protein
MLRFRSPRKRPAAPREETWTDSAFWGATMTLFLVVGLLAGVGYMGYSALERPRQQSVRAASSPPVPAPVRAALSLR